MQRSLASFALSALGILLAIAWSLGFTQSDARALDVSLRISPKRTPKLESIVDAGAKSGGDPSASLGFDTGAISPRPLELAVPTSAFAGRSSADAAESAWRGGRRRAADRFEVPDFEEMTLSDARRLARRQGIRLRASDEEGPLPRRGHAGLREYVIGQSVEAGRAVAGNTIVRLEVELTDWESLNGY